MMADGQNGPSFERYKSLGAGEKEISADLCRDLMRRHGTIFFCGYPRMYSCTGEEMSRLQFNNGGIYAAALCEGSFELFGDRVTKLGTNM